MILLQGSRDIRELEAEGLGSSLSSASNSNNHYALCARSCSTNPESISAVPRSLCEESSITVSIQDGGGDYGTDGVNHLPKDTELICGRAEIPPLRWLLAKRVS